jgi:hypothetical protein
MVNSEELFLPQKIRRYTQKRFRVNPCPYNRDPLHLRATVVRLETADYW